MHEIGSLKIQKSQGKVFVRFSLINDTTIMTEDQYDQINECLDTAMRKIDSILRK